MAEPETDNDPAPKGLRQWPSWLGIGLAALLARWQARPAIPVGVVLLAVSLNLLLLFQYQMFLKGRRDIAPYPRGAYGLGVARFVVPFRVLERFLGR